ncbi:Protein of unknown function DUF4451 [Phaffia rhodozyma]|uniref:Transcription regulator Rua1 C-terminal domain-containing protein n=1 Tax=Phaffia rhodozyma TaxID=264483 RepID=A0A0F7SRC7_PHARH|nr:Protein of unknown function DUF4451 [Phaffia rhodozyma]
MYLFDTSAPYQTPNPSSPGEVLHSPAPITRYPSDPFRYLNLSPFPQGSSPRSERVGVSGFDRTRGNGRDTGGRIAPLSPSSREQNSEPGSAWADVGFSQGEGHWKQHLDWDTTECVATNMVFPVSFQDKVTSLEKNRSPHELYESPAMEKTKHSFTIPLPSISRRQSNPILSSPSLYRQGPSSPINSPPPRQKRIILKLSNPKKEAELQTTTPNIIRKYPLGHINSRYSNHEHAPILEVDEDPDVVLSAATRTLSNLDITRGKRHALLAMGDRWRASQTPPCKQKHLPSPQTSQPSSNDSSEQQHLPVFALKRPQTPVSTHCLGKRKRSEPSPSGTRNLRSRESDLASPCDSVSSMSSPQESNFLPPLSSSVPCSSPGISAQKHWILSTSNVTRRSLRPIRRADDVFSSSEYRPLRTSRFSPYRLPHLRSRAAEKHVPVMRLTSHVRSSSARLGPDPSDSTPENQTSGFLHTARQLSDVDTTPTKVSTPRTELRASSSPISSRLSSLSPSPEPENEAYTSSPPSSPYNPSLDSLSVQRTSKSRTFRTFPPGLEIRDEFKAMYRQFTVPSALPAETCKNLGLPVPTPSAPMSRSATFNFLPRGMLDLYTPRWVQGLGSKKFGVCPICVEDGEDLVALKTKVSAYNYHLLFAHGISPVTGLPFSPPIKFRTSQRHLKRPDEKSNITEGLCHKCKGWIPVEGVKDVTVQVPEIFWWRHAKVCHRSSRVEGDLDIWSPSELLDKLSTYTASLPSEEKESWIIRSDHCS